MGSFPKYIIRFVLFILLQAYVLDKVPPLHEFIKPYLYFLFILWLPFTMPRLGLMVIAFIFGLTMDYFSGTPGLHAACCVLIAYVRPLILNVLLPQEKTEFSYAEPSIKSMGLAPYSVYILLLTFIHHVLLVFIEWMQFGNFVFFIGKVAATTGISVVLIFATEMLFYRKAKYKTNAAY
jgi:rod shape-determining protein MreD